MRKINTNHSIYCRPDYGPIFGLNDIFIGNNANTTVSCRSYLGSAYPHPQPSQGHSYLAGSYQFLLSEIEVSTNFMLFFTFLNAYFTLTYEELIKLHLLHLLHNSIYCKL